MKLNLIVVVVVFLCHFAVSNGANPRPVVLWHGMGDTCCNPLSLGKIIKWIENKIPGIYVHSIQIGNSSEADASNGFFKPINEQIDMACHKFATDPKLINGFNAVGFSQGGQFLRAYVQRCNKPAVYNLITLGGQHQGVFGLPRCPANNILCEEVRRLLELGAYEKYIQEKLVQAQYWKDPFHYATYLKVSLFLNDINNELDTKNQTYKKNLASLNRFVMVKFLKDTMVTPRDSSWFEFYTLGQDKIIEPLKNSTLYQQDWVGLKQLDQQNKLQFLTCDGDHLRFTEQWFEDNIIPLINNNI